MRSKKRLYRLADIFLKSTHLSEKIVASFIKRFARISISAPLPDIVILSRFIQNLLLRHPKLKYMVSLQSEELGSIHSEGSNTNKHYYILSFKKDEREIIEMSITLSL